MVYAKAKLLWKKRKRPAFTLIELLLVIAIMAVLTGIIASMIDVRAVLINSRDAERSHNASQLENAMYQHVVNKWEILSDTQIPDGEESAKDICVVGLTNEQATAADCVKLDLLIPDFLPQLPIDPAEPPTSNYTGYKVYKDMGRPQIVAAHVGELPAEGEEEEESNAGILWTQATANANWAARDSHTSVVFNDGANKMWVMGGFDSSFSRRNDVWSSIDGITWVEETANAGWAERTGHSSVVFNGKMWAMGGIDSSFSRLNDVWSSIDGVTWVEETANAGWTARNGQSSVVFNGKMWVIGGNAGMPTPSVWSSIDGVTWVEETANAGWTRRASHTSVVFNGKMWVIGGFNQESLLWYNDVWSSTDGITWVEETANAGWMKRRSHTSVVFDGRMWVMGGFDDFFSRRNDVWSSTDGITWVEETANADWVARDGYTSVVFNDGTNKMWVIGGQGDSSNVNDVWYSP